MFLAEPPGSLWNDWRLRMLFIGAMVIQVIICFTSVGFFHPDQHFQIIEFSSYQLHKPSAAPAVWELSARIRPTLQVYLFSFYYKICTAVGLKDPYTQLTLLRLLFGGLLWAFFNWITVYYLRNEKRIALYGGLLLLNFSWVLPYTRTLYSSEMLSSLLFFGGLFYYDCSRQKNDRQGLPAMVTGLLFGLAFYARFQTAFAMGGFLFWSLLWEKRPMKLLPLGLGFLLAIGLNVALDYGFYHQLVFTPYDYFRVNLIEGKAASMGTTSFLLYIGVLAAVVLAPPLSILLLSAGLYRSIRDKYKQPVWWTILFFVVGHCFVAHKEERFLFPVLNVLPVVIGWGLPALADWYRSVKRGTRTALKALLGFSIVLNVFLLLVSLLVPYSQSLYFTWQLKRQFGDRPTTIYALERTPFETDAGLPLTFYRSGMPNLEWEKWRSYDSLSYVSQQAKYVTVTYNRIEGNTALLERLGYEKCFCSSSFLWKINEWLKASHVNTLNDIWVLYKRKS